MAALTVLPMVFVPTLPLPAKAVLESELLLANVSDTATVIAESLLWSDAPTVTAPPDQIVIVPWTAAATVLWIVLTLTEADRPKAIAPPPPLLWAAPTAPAIAMLVTTAVEVAETVTPATGVALEPSVELSSSAWTVLPTEVSTTPAPIAAPPPVP